MIKQTTSFPAMEEGFFGKAGSFCVSSTGNVKVKEQDGKTFVFIIFLQNVVCNQYDVHFWLILRIVHALKNYEPSKALWACLFCTWTDYYAVELQISAHRWKNSLVSEWIEESLCNDVASGSAYDSAKLWCLISELQSYSRRDGVWSPLIRRSTNSIH